MILNGDTHIQSASLENEMLAFAILRSVSFFFRLKLFAYTFCIALANINFNCWTFRVSRCASLEVEAETLKIRYINDESAIHRKYGAKEKSTGFNLFSGI